ncbi:MAG: DUF5606 domain-containing protein [Flavobacteriaceae bacterium]|jgi:hypothetical protein
MALEKIIAIGGKPGLYELIAQTKGGFVGESLVDKKRLTVSIRAKVSVLSEIAIYALDREVPLLEVFEAIHKKEEGKETSVSPKADKLALEEYFFSILPNYDEDRVYASDMKKILSWYNLLLNSGTLKEALEAETTEE